MLLQLKGIETGYGANSVLRGIDLEVRAGEIVALLGSNGSGKTTTINAISGVIPIWAGSIDYDGRRVDGLHPSAIVKLKLVQCAEGRQLFPMLTVLENLKLGAYTRGLSASDLRNEIERIYELFPVLLERKQQLAGTLSGGQQQMLAIGRALMAAPRMLLADELSLGLAPIIVRQVFAKLDEVRRTGVTVIVVEQNARLAMKFADYLYVLKYGRVVMEGRREIFERSTDLVDAYLGA